MRTYDPLMFGAIPEDAVMDSDALAMAYEPQPDMPFLESNPDLPASETDPRGLLKASPSTSLNASPLNASNMAPGNEISAPEDMDAIEDPEALQQAILEAQGQYNSNSLAYQTATVEENDEAQKRALQIEEGLA